MVLQPGASQGGQNHSQKYVKTEDQLADIGAKHLSKQGQRYLLKLISEFRA